MVRFSLSRATTEEEIARVLEILPRVVADVRPRLAARRRGPSAAQRREGLVIVECDQCQAKYHYDEARFAGKPSKKLRCSKCRAIFEIFNTHAYEAQPPCVRRSRPARPARGGPRRCFREASVRPRAGARAAPVRGPAEAARWRRSSRSR